MLFNSFVFAALFLPLTLLAFWMAPQDRARRAVLLATSLFFYGYWHWPYLLLLVGLVAIAWYCAMAVERTHSKGWIAAAAVLLLGTLGYFKYAGFLVSVGQDLGLLSGGSRRIHELALPIGISFIAFQALGYVVDVWRGEFRAERQFHVVLLFKAFFPQLIAGPICRAHELMPQLRHFHPSLRKLLSGAAIFAVGLMLKEVFADGLAPLVDSLFLPGAVQTRAQAWAASVGFAFQIYADFWGYSTMAVGLARMFGVEIPVNFRLPYLATSMREFWRGWHITLSQWLRDYLYKPLGGSRHGALRTAWALMVTMLLGGLWHGANYTFVVWGAIHGVVQVIEHWLGRRETAAGSRIVLVGRRVLGWAYAMLVVLIAWVFFRAQDLGQAAAIIQQMFVGPSAGTLGSEVRQIFTLSAALFILQVPIERLLRAVREERLRPDLAFGVSFWAVLGAVVLGAPAAVPFIYFQF